MITVETTPMQKAQARCETCWKMIEQYNSGLITQAVINLINARAERHIRLHPTHNVEVLIYESAPQTPVLE